MVQMVALDHVGKNNKYMLICGFMMSRSSLKGVTKATMRTLRPTDSPMANVQVDKFNVCN